MVLDIVDDTEREVLVQLRCSASQAGGRCKPMSWEACQVCAVCILLSFWRSSWWIWRWRPQKRVLLSNIWKGICKVQLRCSASQVQTYVPEGSVHSLVILTILMIILINSMMVETIKRKFYCWTYCDRVSNKTKDSVLHKVVQESNLVAWSIQDRIFLFTWHLNRTSWTLWPLMWKPHKS